MKHTGVLPSQPFHRLSYIHSAFGVFFRRDGCCCQCRCHACQSQTTEHGWRPAKHTDNTARHRTACRWNNMAVRARFRHAAADTALLIKVEVERHVQPGHTEQQEATSNNSSADQLLQTENICSRKYQNACTLLLPNTAWLIATTLMSELSHIRHSE